MYMLHKYEWHLTMEEQFVSLGNQNDMRERERERERESERERERERERETTCCRDECNFL